MLFDYRLEASLQQWFAVDPPDFDCDARMRSDLRMSAAGSFQATFLIGAIAAAPSSANTDAAMKTAG